jgi:hypothetical protein
MTGAIFESNENEYSGILCCGDEERSPSRLSAVLALVGNSSCYEHSLYDDPVFVVLLFLVPAFQFDTCPAARTSIAEEEEHIIFGLYAFEVMCWSKDSY